MSATLRSSFPDNNGLAEIEAKALKRRLNHLIMVLLTKATTGVATQAEGTFTNCRAGSDSFELSYNCHGPACSSLDGSFLDIVCHKDGKTRLICSNSSKCQSGASSYQSNFTFSQNDPDPWSPLTENEPDTWIPQHQHVMVAECARFSVTSDGTRQGTRLSNESLADSCPNFESLPMAKESAGEELISTGRPRAAATQMPLVVAGATSRYTVSTSSFLIAFTFAWLLLFPGTFAAATHHRHRGASEEFGVNVRADSDNLKAFAKGFRTRLAQQADRQGIDGEALADRVVATAILSVCASHFEGSAPIPFTPGVVEYCVSSVYDDTTLPQAGLRFLVVFGASLLCDYVVSEAYPNGQSFVRDGCDGLHDLVHGVRTTNRVTIPPTSFVSSTAYSDADGPGTQPDQRLNFDGEGSQRSAFSSTRTSPSSSKTISTIEPMSLSSFPAGTTPSTGVLLMDNLVSSEKSTSISLPETISLAISSGVTTLLSHDVAASVQKLSSGLLTLDVSPAASVQTASPVVETPSRGISMSDSFESGSTAAALADSMLANVMSGDVHSGERLPNSLSLATVSGVMLHSGHSSLVDSALAVAAVDTVALGLPAHSSSEIARTSKQKEQSPEPTSLAISIATPQASLRSFKESMSNTFQSVAPVDQVTISAEDDSSVSEPNEELSTGWALTAKTTTLNKVTKSAGSKAKLTMPSSAAQTDVVSVDLGTKSWSELSLTASSQTSVITKASQPSAMPSLDHERRPTGQNRFRQSYYSNSSAPVLESWTFADTSSADSTWNTSATSSTALILSIPTNNSSTFLPSVSEVDTTRAPFISTDLPLNLTSRQPSVGSVKNFDFDVTPPVKITTASAASGPVARPPISSGGGTGLLDDQAKTTEQLVVTRVEIVTVPFGTVFTSSSMESSNDQDSTVSCIQNIAMSEFCPGSGCVNLMTDNAHCGACNQACKHNCRQGTCICPDYTGPDGDSGCLHPQPGMSACSTGYTQDDFKVCAPDQMTALSSGPAVGSKSAKTQPPHIPIAVLSFASPASRAPNTVSVTSMTQISAVKAMECPSDLPHMCNGSCFNTRIERNHCGGCGNYCSGTCIDRQCLATSTPSRQQLVSVWRTITVTKVLTASPFRDTVSPTPSPPQVASYIWKGVIGF